jgi:hypothetical protein
VNDPCTGTATSTFGGGGGTKVFCSQALKTPNAATAKAARQTVTPFCPAALVGLDRAGEREAFIFSCPSTFFVLQKALIEKPAFRHPIKSSNNPLAVEPETENDAPRLNLLLQSHSRF